MADPATQSSTQVSEQLPADRDVRIAELLRSGLAHYFRGQFEPAIDVWARVPLLDRDHPLACDCIDRARAAVAALLRESEALAAEGRFVDGLGVLSRVGVGDDDRVDVDRMRVEFQRAALGALLSSVAAQGHTAGSGSESGRS
ncbi:MAG: hypothetical protein CL483_10895 [Acidobacteria bacterium]|nr:hypothetical protein [Acidobacteriota bacterium]